MNHLDFILWLVLAPISVAVCSLLSAKQNKITGKKEIEFPDHVNKTFAWVCFGIFTIIAFKLY